MTNSVTITLRLPDVELRPNFHRNTKYKQSVFTDKKKAYKELACAEGLGVRQDSMPWGKVSISYRFFWENRRWPDPDNAIGSMKWVLDAWTARAGCGLVKDDRYENVGWPTGEYCLDKHNPRVEVTIERIE
jgi:hypothetical protein